MISVTRVNSGSVCVAIFKGDDKAFCVVRVPSVEEEMRRARVRQRNALSRERIQMSVRGRSVLLCHGISSVRDWWRPAPWAILKKNAPAAICALVEPWRELIIDLRQRQLRLEREITSSIDSAQIPVGVGAWSWACLSAELCDWRRFRNRRQIASYTGFCPSEHTTGGRRRQGSINKHGNPQVRHTLIEMLWRIVRFQPQWRGLKKLPSLINGNSSPRQRRKAAVAGARMLAIDLWRLATGQTTPQKLGLRMA
jgi:transposase